MTDHSMGVPVTPEPLPPDSDLDRHSYPPQSGMPADAIPPSEHRDRLAEELRETRAEVERLAARLQAREHVLTGERDSARGRLGAEVERAVKAEAEVKRLRAILADVAEEWPCPNPDDPTGCYCHGDQHVDVAQFRRWEDRP